MGTHADVPLFSCDQCSMTFQTLSLLNEHHRTHTGEKPYACEICCRTFTKQSRLMAHIGRHGSGQFMCSYCKASFSDARHSHEHKMESHGIKGCTCQHCPKTFAFRSKMLEHQRLHIGKKFMCRFCGKPFSTLDMMRKHERIHTGERPYMCRFCSKRFTFSKSLNRHELSHTNSSP